MAFLMIENTVTSIPSVDILCTLGASASRGNVTQIGQFGSGFPYSLALFAREGILDKVKICLGKDVYTFFVESVKAKTGSGDDFGMDKIVMKKQNGGKYPLNISTEFGAIDWTNIDMGIREFVSNAFDGSMASFGDYGHACIKEMDNDRAKDGTVRVYLPMTQSVRSYLAILSTRFLMIDPTYDPDKRILPNYDGSETRFYRKGVFVGSGRMGGLFHYNIPDLKLKESRNLEEWSAYGAAGQSILLADQTTIETFLQSLKSEQKIYEHKIDSYYLKIDECHFSIREKAEKNQETWKKAYVNVFGDSLITDNKAIGESVERKGRKVTILPTKFIEILESNGIERAEIYLTKDEIEGKTILPPTQTVIACFNAIWSKLERHNLTKNVAKPELRCYTQPMESESITMGYYHNGIITIHQDIAIGDSLMLQQTMLEEIAHHVTKATDNSRDFQDYAFRLAAVFMFASDENREKTMTIDEMKEELRQAKITTNGNPAVIVGWKQNDATIQDIENGVYIMTSWESLYRRWKAGQTDF